MIDNSNYIKDLQAITQWKVYPTKNVHPKADANYPGVKKRHNTLICPLVVFESHFCPSTLGVHKQTLKFIKSSTNRYTLPTCYPTCHFLSYQCLACIVSCRTHVYIYLKVGQLKCLFVHYESWRSKLKFETKFQDPIYVLLCLK